MQKVAIGFIGGGNMARSLISGILASDFNANRLWVCDHDQTKCDYFEQKYQINTTTDALTLVEHCQVVVLAVKPIHMAEVAFEIAKITKIKKPLIISIAAGIPISTLESWYGATLPIVRAMPNTPSLVRAGATGLYQNGNLATQQVSQAEYILRSCGVITWVKDESLIDVITALSGSGPAYFFRVMELLADIATEFGLTKEQAQLFTVQTAYGAARMALESSESLSKLREQVTSKGGVTQVALDVLEKHNLKAMLTEALAENIKHSSVLADQYKEMPKLDYNQEKQS
ncbi:pyrroline-5-carboxylate reductase [Thiotrichales bacterium 19S11-10]|nr:pyrroline-5-carboxylate reductase [Thiotrichales bacterium 19S11-10]MCF6808110.1 pyrroline-5-carboxylate reductase [Thiotrichales bacterium 19S9-11]MCF6812126.1 pyrroline-5-carboxylate reductase [Thiotrichales bacterium 19S9-12]